MNKTLLEKTTLFAALLAVAPQARAAFDITISGLEDTVFRTYFDQAAAFWESAITGYADASVQAWFDSNNDSGITISASMENLGANILGQAGPTYIIFDGENAMIYTTEGEMAFNTDYYSEASVTVWDQTFYDTVRHEMGHVLGIGALWNVTLADPQYSGIVFNEVLDQNNPLHYIGAHALANYQTEFSQPEAGWVPLENDGGEGTAGGHWDEVAGGAGDTGIVSEYEFKDMRYELMTGWANSPMFLSSVTLGALEDLGYKVDYSVLTGVPEPGTYALWSGAVLLAGAVLRRRRKPRN